MHCECGKPREAEPASRETMKSALALIKAKLKGNILTGESRRA